MRRTILLIVLSAWLLLPTGTPDDVIAVFMMRLLGPLYILLVLVLLVVMWHYKVNFKVIAQGTKEIIKDVKRFFK